MPPRCSSHTTLLIYAKFMRRATRSRTALPIHAPFNQIRAHRRRFHRATVACGDTSSHSANKKSDRRDCRSDFFTLYNPFVCNHLICSLFACNRFVDHRRDRCHRHNRSFIRKIFHLENQLLRRLLRVVDSAALADDLNLDLSGVLHLALDTLNDLARGDDHLIVGDLIGFDHYADLAAGLDCV